MRLRKNAVRKYPIPILPVFFILSIFWFQLPVSTAEDNCETASEIIEKTIKNFSDPDTQIREYKRASELCPDLWQADYNLAAIFLKQGKHEEAGAIFKKLSKSVDNTHVMSGLGKYYIATGNLDEAEKAYQLSIDHDQDNIKPLLALAFVHQKKGEMEKAVRVLEGAMRLDSNHSLVLYNLGVLYEKDSDSGKALEYYRKSSIANPQDYLSRLRSGLIMLQRGQAEQSLIELRKAATLNSSDRNVFIAIGEAYRKTGDLERAELNYLRALDMQGDKAPVLNKLANILFQLNKPNQVLELLLTHGSGTDRMNRERIRARALTELGEYDQAEKCLESIIKEDSTQAELYNDLGVLNIRRGNVAKAQENFKKALSLNPDFDEAARNLSRLEVR